MRHESLSPSPAFKAIRPHSDQRSRTKNPKTKQGAEEDIAPDDGAEPETLLSRLPSLQVKSIQSAWQAEWRYDAHEV